MDFALGITVKSTGVKTAATDLERLTKAATNAKAPVEGAQKVLQGLSDVDFSKSVAQFSNLSGAIGGIKGTFKGITESSNNFKGLSNSFTKLADATERLYNSAGGLAVFHTNLIKIRDVLASMQGYSGMLGDIAASSKSISRASTGSTRVSSGSGGSGDRSADISGTEGLTQAQKRLAAQIEREAFLVKGTKAEWLEYKAAQQGISASMAPYIAQMKGASQATQHLGMSAKATAQAMRMVPAQLTDIVTQLAGGQNPFLIMVQQGGQLRDMFGGFGNMFKNVGGMIAKFLTPAVIAIGAVTSAVGIMAYGFIKGSNEASEFGKALALTNNYLGINKDQFSTLTKEMEKSVGTRALAAETLTAMASAGIKAGIGFESLATTIAKFSKVTGQSVEELSKLYADIQKSPLEALKKFDDQTHAITASTLLYVEAALKQGDTLKAVQIATEAVASAQDKMARESVASAGYVERAWRGVKSTFSELGDSIANVGRQTTVADKLRAIQSKLDQGKSGNVVLDKAGKAALEEEQKRLQMSLRFDEAMQKQANRLRDQEDTIKKIVSVQSSELPTYAKKLDLTNKLLAGEKALAALKSTTILKGDQKQEAIDKQIQINAGIKKQMEEKPASVAGASKLAGLQAELQAQQENLSLLQKFPDVYDKISDKQKQMYSTEKLIASGALKGKQLSDAKAELEVLKQVVGVETQVNDAQRSIDGVNKWREVGKATEAANQSLEEQLTYIKLTGDYTDIHTQSEKEYAKAAIASANTKLSLEERNQAALESLSLARQSSLEKEIISQKELAKEAQKLALMPGQQAVELEELNRQLDKQNEGLGVSNAEMQQRQQLSAVQITYDKQMLETQEKMNKAKGDAQQIAQLKLEQDLLAQSLKDKQNAITSRSLTRGKEGESLYKDAKAASIDFYNGLQTRQQMFQEAFTSSYGLMSDAITTFAETGKFSFKDFAISVLKMIEQMVVKMLLLKAIQAVTGFADGGTFGKTASGGTIPQYYTGGGVGNSIQKNANGNSFSNSVLTKPTMFAHGGTLNVAGEAGPEAVMPLKRLPSGKLGVMAQGGGGSGGNSVTVITNIYPGGNTETDSKGSSSDMAAMGAIIGNKVRAVIVEELRPRGLLEKAA